MAGVNLSRLKRAVMVLLIVCSSFQTALGNDLPADLRAALESMPNKLSPLSIEWVRTRSSRVPAAQWAQRGIPWAQDEFLADATVTYRLDFPRCYFHIYEGTPQYDKQGRRLPGRSLRKRARERSFDGATIYSGTGQDTVVGDVMLFLKPLEIIARKEPNLVHFQPDYFYEAGVKLPSTPKEFYSPWESVILHKLATGGSLKDVQSVNHEGQACQLIEIALTDGSVKYILDPSMDYALRQREEFSSNNKLARRIRCTQFRQVGDRRLWLPTRIESTNFAWDRDWAQLQRSPLYIEVFHVRSLSADAIESERFVLRYDKPGTYIWDQKEDLTYRIPADPEDLEAVIAAAREGREYIPEPRRKWLKAAGIGFTTLVLIALVLGLLQRRRRSLATGS